jgi:hypothetical protein
MMSEKRKKYTPTEKAKIALEAIKSELTFGGSRDTCKIATLELWVFIVHLV